MGPSRYFWILRGTIQVLFLLKCLVVIFCLFLMSITPVERTFTNRTTKERRLHGRNWHRSTMEHTTVERGAHGCSGFSLIFQNLEAYQA